MDKTIKGIQKNIKNCFLVLFIFAISFPQVALAASLNFSPSAGTHDKNKTFSVGVFVSSPDQSMNAASAIIKFPTDKLQVTSVSKSGSIVDFWAQEPSFSNAIGEIKLEGIVLTPGYKGNSGKLITISFKGKNAGTADLKIFSSSVLANDGIGTNILAGVSGAKFTINEVAEKEPEPIKVNELDPVDQNLIEANNTKESCGYDSLVSSSTHPGVVWKKENNASFSWELPEGTLASKVALDRNPDTEPLDINNPAIVEKRYDNLEDGIWYFHLSLQNESGWSKTEHFKIKVDSTPPTIEAREVQRLDSTDPRPVIKIKLEDETSCIRDFELSINGEILDYEKLEGGDLKISVIEPGDHELVVTAYDKAGNKSEKFLNIFIEGIDSPEITDFPKTIKAGEILEIKGQAISNSALEVEMTSKRRNILIRQTIKADANGIFTLKQEGLKQGTIFVSLRASDSRGALSKWSKPVEIKVVGKSGISLDHIMSSLGIEMIIAIGVFILLLSILITRALTIRRIRKELDL